jgi:hypothetical protein
MYTKNDLITSIKNEIRIIRHLFEKIPAGSESYKPTEKQRTTLELLQYLSMVTPATVAAIVSGDSAAFGPYVAASKDVTMDNFLEVLAVKEAEAIEMIEKMDDEALAGTIDLFRMGPMSRGVYLVETILKWLAAYKMQLFLYAKAAGNHTIGTSNVWGGFDVPVQ